MRAFFVYVILFFVLWGLWRSLVDNMRDSTATLYTMVTGGLMALALWNAGHLLWDAVSWLF